LRTSVASFVAVDGIGARSLENAGVRGREPKQNQGGRGGKKYPKSRKEGLQGMATGKTMEKNDVRKGGSGTA